MRGEEEEEVVQEKDVTSLASEKTFYRPQFCSSRALVPL